MVYVSNYFLNEADARISKGVHLHGQVLYDQLLRTPPGSEGSKGKRLSGAI